MREGHNAKSNKTRQLHAAPACPPVATHSYRTWHQQSKAHCLQISQAHISTQGTVLNTSGQDDIWWASGDSKLLPTTHDSQVSNGLPISNLSSVPRAPQELWGTGLRAPEWAWFSFFHDVVHCQECYFSTRRRLMLTGAHLRGHTFRCPLLLSSPVPNSKWLWKLLEF